MAVRMDSGTAIVTFLLLLNNAPSPKEGRSADGFFCDKAHVYGDAVSLETGLDKTIFTAYSVIQLSMIPEMTSLTFRYAFKAPVKAPSKAPATIAPARHTYHGMLKIRASARAAPAPASY